MTVSCEEDLAVVYKLAGASGEVMPYLSKAYKSFRPGGNRNSASKIVPSPLV